MAGVENRPQVRLQMTSGNWSRINEATLFPDLLFGSKPTDFHGFLWMFMRNRGLWVVFEASFGSNQPRQMDSDVMNISHQVTNVVERLKWIERTTLGDSWAL